MLFDALGNNLFFKDWTIRTNLVCGLALNIIMWAGIYYGIAPRVEPIALRYNIYFGINFIGPWYYGFIFPLIGFVLILINSCLAYLVFLRLKLLAYFLILNAIVCQLLLIIMSTIIILLNR